MTQVKEKSAVAHLVIGSWKLKSWCYKDAGGNDVDFFGENPQGILTYDPSGYMSAHIMKSNRQLLSSEAMHAGSDEEIVSAYKSYFAYYGKYYEEEPGTIIHVVEGGLFPNWINNTEKRYAKVEGDKLTISTPPIEADGHPIVFHLVWERA